MKTNELFVGAWVTSKKWREKPFKITRINDSGKYYFGITAEGSQVGPFLIEELEPIPLTVEMLEKNGWRSRVNGPGEFYLKKPLVDPAIVTKAIIGFQMNHGPFSGLFIHYIHELQNALCLCGIEKEIEL